MEIVLPSALRLLVAFFLNILLVAETSTTIGRVLQGL